ncbi:hypothetical protein [Kamptonema formosum]|nr:hypothetical protein [Oscillatoria sp. PCC 10802]
MERPARGTAPPVLPSKKAASDGLATIGAISGGDCETMDFQPEVVWACQN